MLPRRWSSYHISTRMSACYFWIPFSPGNGLDYRHIRGAILYVVRQPAYDQ